MSQNSPAIDAGNPSDDYSNEPSPNGNIINMGIYGNTIYASKSSWVADNAMYIGYESKTYSSGLIEQQETVLQGATSLNNVFKMVVIWKLNIFF